MAKHNHENAEQFGRAWALHRQGQNDAAIKEFDALLKTSVDDIDAYYGRGLAERSSGQIEAARGSFEKCLAKVEAALEAAPDEDRWQMLQRMTSQRLNELKAK